LGDAVLGLDHAQDNAADTLKTVLLLCGQIAVVSGSSVSVDHMEHREPLLNLPCMGDRIGVFFGEGELAIEGSDG
jgi:hypothetical protein